MDAYETDHCSVQSIEAAKAAWGRLQEGNTWEDWCLVGSGLMVGVKHAMNISKKEHGKKFNIVMGPWLEKHGFDDVDPRTRSCLRTIFEDRDILKWRSGLNAPGKRASFNHPAVVLSAYRRAHNGPAVRKSAEAKLKEVLVKVKKLAKEIEPSPALDPLVDAVVDYLKTLTPDTVGIDDINDRAAPVDDHEPEPPAAETVPQGDMPPDETEEETEDTEYHGGYAFDPKEIVGTENKAA